MLYNFVYVKIDNVITELGRKNMNKNLLLCAIMVGTLTLPVMADEPTNLVVDGQGNGDSTYKVIADYKYIEYANITIQNAGVLHINGNGHLTVTGTLNAVDNGTSSDHRNCAIQNDGYITTNKLVNTANITAIYPSYGLGHLTVTNGGSNSSTSSIEQYDFSLTGGTFENSGVMTIYNSLTNDADATLVNNEGSTVRYASTFTNNGTYTNKGTTSSIRTLTNNGSIDNSGTLSITSNLYNGGDSAGTLTNTGKIEVSDTLENASGSTISNTTSGSIKSKNLYNSGTVNNAGIIEVSETLGNVANATIANSGAIKTAILVNQGTISGYNGALGSIELTNGSSSNSGSISASNFTVDSSASIANSGSIQTGTLTNQGTISGYNGALGSIELTSGSSSNLGSISASSFTVDSGASLTNSNSLSATNLTNDGTLTNDTKGSILAETITNSSSLTNSGTIGSLDNAVKTFTNSGTLTNNSGASIVVTTLENSASATIANSGTINSTTLKNAGTVENSSSIIASTIENAEGSTIANSGSIKTAVLVNQGTISGYNGASGSIELTSGDSSNSGSISASNFIVDSSASIANSGLIQTGTLTNQGTISGTTGSIELISGDSSNTGSISANSFTIDSSASLTNSNSLSAINLTNDGTLTNDTKGSILAETITNSSSLTNSGTIGSSDNAVKTLTNNGSISNLESGTITVSGNFENKDKTTFANSGVVNMSMDSTMKNSSGSSITNSGKINLDEMARINNLSGSKFDNKGEIVVGNDGCIGNDANSTFNNDTDGKIALSGAFINYGTTTNAGSITGSDEGSIISIGNRGTFTNTSTGVISKLEVDNACSNDFDSIFTNNGEIKDSRYVTNRSDNDKSSIINNNNKWSVSDGVENYGSGIFNNAGELTISGTLYNRQSATFNNSNSISTKKLINKESAIFNNSVGAEIKVSDTLTNSASLYNAGTITTAVLNNTNLITGVTDNAGTTVYGDLSVNAGTNSENSVIEVKDFTTTLNEEIGIDTFTNDGTITSYGTFTNNIAITGGESSVLNVTNGSNSSEITQNIITVGGNFANNAESTITANESLTVNTNGALTNNGTLTSQTVTIENNGTLNNSGENASVEITDTLTNSGNLYLTNGSKTTIKSLASSGYIRLSSVSDVSIDEGTSTGTIETLDGESTLNASNLKISGNFNIGDGVNDAILNLAGGTIADETTVNIASKGRLNVQKDVDVTLNNGDTVNGDLSVSGGSVTFDGFNFVSGATSTLEGGNQQYYEQSGGKLSLLNNSSLTMIDSSKISGGTMVVDDNSKYTSLKNGYTLDELTISGLHEAMNTQQEDYNITNMYIGNSISGDSQADFTIDFIARSNARNTSDHFVSENIAEADGLSNATINISDWTLGGDIYGWDAPIDRHIDLGKVFMGNISKNINFTATDKETFTPIGWYKLNALAGGSYSIDLTRFNKQVFRGQVTTVAQYMNQLSVDDLLFTHSMTLPSFKDEDATGMSANRYASANPVFAPYQYSRKDGGLWVKMYGTFENLQMNNGIGQVSNNAYGTLIGADFGLKDLKHGWKFMPTAYIGYNGAHQTFHNVGAYQNGGQIGFLGTWYKNQTIIGGLVYGGAYDNSMSVYGHSDDTFNYFGGAATKIAHNFRIHKDFVLQPNLMAAYNFFGQQNWHSDFGQMGMMSSTLNGVNVAPGLNLIWEKETFSAYATIQYMFNLNGAVGGRAGNVSLPHTEMERGYIQYGIGFVKKFSDRVSGYLQAVIRNVGRNGLGFQLGFNIKLGK
jgi:hypothetical protein